ncbi:dephospho-CoA kinase [Rouxiella sp. Mn2063]|uniref:dephospho-CoA kinase n=1 Tax=Rouxiella sp. Mn2063 TaxID=3395262 RepID=UPI003BC80ADD
MSYIVALTGGIGSGKSTVANAFATRGAAIVDADVIAREVVQPGEPALEALAQRFGKQIIHSDGSLNRPLLREKIFNNSEDKQWVNNLLHPLIHARTQQIFREASAPYILWVVPLLVENGLQSKANRVLVVDVTPEIQLSRTTKRDNVSLQQAQQIISAQVSRPQRLAYADDIIDNNSTPDTIEPRVKALHNCYLKLAASVPR